MQVLDIHSQSTDERARRLSNFTPRSFNFNGVQCASVESVLQAWKISDVRMQQLLCLKSAHQVHLQKSALDRMWQKSQLLHWGGVRYARTSAEYAALTTALYDTVYEQDQSFRVDVLAAAGCTLTHQIGKYCQRSTVLTNPEFLGQLYRLQVRALAE